MRRLLLSACGSAKNRAGVDRVPAAAFSSDRDGVIIFSTGTSQPCTGASTFLQVHDEASMKLVPRAAAAPVDGKSGKSDFSDHLGAINAFALPPGRYYLSPVTSNPHVAGAATLAFRFEVRAGETSYLGELFMPRSCTLLTAFEVRDQFARDIALAAAKNPAVTWHPPVRRLLAGAEPAQPSTAGLPPVPPAATAPSASPAVAARPAGVAPATELWAGSMVCGPRSDGRNPGPYDVKFSMEVHGHNVTVFRNTATASEILTGRSDDRQLELRGKGFRRTNHRETGNMRSAANCRPARRAIPPAAACCRTGSRYARAS